MSHSLKNFRDPLFLFRKIMFGLFFFFPPIFGMIFVFFFPRKSLPSLTHSIEKRVFFFRVPEKKKTGFSLIHSIFAEKSQKTNYSQEKKKYATFGGVVPKIHSRSQRKKRDFPLCFGLKIIK